MSVSDTTVAVFATLGAFVVILLLIFLNSVILWLGWNWCLKDLFEVSKEITFIQAFVVQLVAKAVFPGSSYRNGVSKK